ncbi:VUT family protein [Olsenella sp. Marseille-P4559]|uniref:VUT family protein n=1 Tax=Olsenella sp. Marseille-P4559 TaxID=2364795 RepID=UPI001030A46A|nr:VUT family protein [Olsenella sp. Marseille-P4559]
MLRQTLEDYKVLLRSIPSATVTLFVVSVIVMNLLANKELVSLPWLALDCGFCVSWVSFLCMDMICKRFGANASIKVSLLALAINLAVCVLFWLASMTPGMWGAYYDTGSLQVNDALNATFGGSWYVVAGSSVAMLCSSVTNSLLNEGIGRRLRKNTFGAFALRSYASTLVGQFVDNLVFATIVSHTFFGWTWLQVLTCSLTGAIFELLCEVFLSPVGYRVVRGWERERVGEEYLHLHAAKATGAEQ